MSDPPNCHKSPTSYLVITRVGHLRELRSTSFTPRTELLRHGGGPTPVRKGHWEKRARSPEVRKTVNPAFERDAKAIAQIRGRCAMRNFFKKLVSGRGSSSLGPPSCRQSPTQPRMPSMPIPFSWSNSRLRPRMVFESGQTLFCARPNMSEPLGSL